MTRPPGLSSEGEEAVRRLVEIGVEVPGPVVRGGTVDGVLGLPRSGDLPRRGIKESDPHLRPTILAPQSGCGTRPPPTSLPPALVSSGGSLSTQPMTPLEREALEASIRAQCDAKDYDAAATLAIKRYGAEIFGFLVTLNRDEQEASDVFAIVCENLWRGLPKFGCGSTLRTWVYTITRHASLRHKKNVQGRARGAVPMSDYVSVLAAEVRTATQQFLKTEQKDAFTRIRESLPAEDRMLLVLRVDRELAWNDLARIMHGGEPRDDGGEPGEGACDESEEALKREAARLRKRFQLVKEKLLELGRREGLVQPKD